MSTESINNAIGQTPSSLFNTAVRFKVGEEVRTQVVDKSSEKVVRELPDDLHTGRLIRLYA